MTINIYSIGPFLSGILLILLGFYVLLKDIKNPINQSFFASAIPTALWLTTYSFLYNASSHSQETLHFYRIAYCFVIFIPIGFFTFITGWLGLKWTKTWNTLNYIYGFILSYFFITTPHFISGTYSHFFGTYPKAGSLHWIFLIYFFILISVEIIFLSLNSIKETDKHKQNQIKLLLLAYTLIACGCVDFIPNYGIEIYPLGFIFALIFLLIISYAIFKHNLLEIKNFISNSIVYSILIALVFLFYSVTVLILERHLQNYLGYNSLSLSIVCAFIIGLVVVPLKNVIQNLIDTSLLRGSPVQISEENTLLRQELNNANKLRTVAILASELAHEIKNPITTINTFAEYLPNKLGDIQFLNKCRQTLLHESSRIQSLLGQLLSYAKPTPPNFESVNPQDILEEILILIEHKCVKQHIEIKKNYAANQVILADPNQLKQAFLNIIINAIESMPEAGTLTIETGIIKNTYTISIKDTGAGISKEDISKIFTPFYTNKKDGTGLGLSITQGIIRDHGGTISIESQVMHHTTFKVELPLRPANPKS